MAKLKTQKTDESVEDFLQSIENDTRRADAIAVSELMAEVTGAEPAMWGKNIVGFGAYRYKYASGRNGEWFVAGFSPRKANLTLYIMAGFSAYEDLMAKLGKHKTGKSCLYIKKLEDVDTDVLRTLVDESVKMIKERHPD